MELSQRTVSAILERFMDEGIAIDVASEYGEPGYSAEGPTPAVVLGNYWCRCGAPDDLHEHATHRPHLWARLEAQGVQFEWYDEWTVDYENGKAYRTQPDSYSWQPSFVLTEDCEMLTPDDELDTWVGWATEDPSVRCIPSTIANGADVETLGFIRHNGQFESGWHPGQTDDPKAIVAALRERYGDGVEIVFTLDYTGQFDAGFSAYYRVTTEYVATINVPGYLPMDDDPPVFSDARSAWEWLAEERERGEDMTEYDADDPAGDEYSETRETLAALGTEAHWSHPDAALWLAENGLAPDGTGTVYGDTPGYSGDHDLGLAYSVSLTERG